MLCRILNASSTFMKVPLAFAGSCPKVGSRGRLPTCVKDFLLRLLKVFAAGPGLAATAQYCQPGATKALAFFLGG